MKPLGGILEGYDALMLPINTIDDLLRAVKDTSIYTDEFIRLQIGKCLDGDHEALTQLSGFSIHHTNMIKYWIFQTMADEKAWKDKMEKSGFKVLSSAGAVS